MSVDFWIHSEAPKDLLWKVPTSIFLDGEFYTIITCYFANRDSSEKRAREIIYNEYNVKNNISICLFPKNKSRVSKINNAIIKILDVISPYKYVVLENSDTVLNIQIR